jgi:hypothetical protein
MLTVSPSVILVVSLAEQLMHGVSILQFLIAIGVSILLIPVTWFLNIVIVSFLKMETTVFLFPGMMKTTRVYGWREAIGRLLVALVISIVIWASIFFTLRLFWG